MVLPASYSQPEMGLQSNTSEFGSRPSGVCCKAEDEEEFHLSVLQRPRAYAQINKGMSSPKED